mmetsp:Transcript_35670/g.65408  ORF Transcript_35670/g.65408 Transcript_35670/m.65408 type:complete len:204 (-) Transcript_35670:57-668(-)
MGNTCCVPADGPPPKSAAVSSAYADEYSAVPALQLSGGVVSQQAEPQVKQEDAVPLVQYEQKAALSDGPREELIPEPPVKAPPPDKPVAEQATIQEAKPTLPLTVVDSQDGGDTYVEVVIARESLEERLGLDLKHCKNHLLVKQIQDGDVTDKYNQSQTDPMRRLTPGDTVWKVNEVEKSDVDMIRECRQNLIVKLYVKKLAK